MIVLRLQSYEPIVAEPKIPQAQTQTLDNVDRVQFKVVFHGSFPGVSLHQLVAFTYFVCLKSSVERIASSPLDTLDVTMPQTRCCVAVGLEYGCIQ